MNEVLLRFKRHGTLAVVGQMVELDLMNCLNSTAWKGKGPQTCKLVRFQQVKPVSRDQTTDFLFTVCYRPPGAQSEIAGQDAWSGLWSEGWKIKHIKINKEGVLLDAEGNPLPKGQAPVVVEHSLYKTVDYNLFDFGTEVDEAQVEGAA